MVQGWLPSKEKTPWLWPAKSFLGTVESPYLTTFSGDSFIPRSSSSPTSFFFFFLFSLTILFNLHLIISASYYLKIFFVRQFYYLCSCIFLVYEAKKIFSILLRCKKFSYMHRHTITTTYITVFHSSQVWILSLIFLPIRFLTSIISFV